MKQATKSSRDSTPIETSSIVMQTKYVVALLALFTITSDAFARGRGDDNARNKKENPNQGAAAAHQRAVRPNAGTARPDVNVARPNVSAPVQPRSAPVHHPDAGARGG